MQLKKRVQALTICLVGCLFALAGAEIVEVGGRRFTIPDGFKLELATMPKLSERPIVVDFDEAGCLYVAESSGTNDKVEKQLAEKPHSILRLADTNGDGVFETRTVFADRMMFPEGMLCHRGSVFVAAPPQIWKLTDTNNDGVTDNREVWFDGQTLTGCANDLHGPYLGLDGWIYWCKGAFAEQTYQTTNRRPLTTRAAHIFRRRPEGGPVEPVMTGGMDNPVEVVFTPTGERIFTTTFFQHPGDGKRDGLVHAIYGGVYGKSHGVIEGHPRTGELMPVMTHLGAAAPSGLVRLESNSLGYEGQLLTACFNLHSITRHELVPHGATYETRDSTLVSCDDLDFHPTDVIEDADGSVLIVDTGGWYKLCCPTSQLEKPDVPGAIYRLSKIGAAPTPDSRGLGLDWEKFRPRQLGDLLDDQRFVVRRRAMDSLAQLGSAAVTILNEKLSAESSVRTRRNAVWAATRIADSGARRVVRKGLEDPHPSVRQAACHGVGIWRDVDAVERLVFLMSLDNEKEAHVKRAMAEALGRIGAESDFGSLEVEALLGNLANPVDRVLEHSLIYALIEINNSQATQHGLVSGNATQMRGALLALREMANGNVPRDEIAKLIVSNDKDLRMLAAEFVLAQRDSLPSAIEQLRVALKQDVRRLDELNDVIGLLSSTQEGAEFAGELLSSSSVGPKQKSALIDKLASSTRLDQQLSTLLENADAAVALAIVNKTVAWTTRSDTLKRQLHNLAQSDDVETKTRLIAARQLGELDDRLFSRVTEFLGPAETARLRSLALGVLGSSSLTDQQLAALAGKLEEAGPLEVSRLLRVFEGTDERRLNDELGKRIFNSLASSGSVSSVPAGQLASLAAKFGDETSKLAKPLLLAASLDPAEKAKKLSAVLEDLPKGDVRRGQELFHSQKLACFACHAIGYRGGTVGPDLSRIARTRARRDLLEAIVFPSASFVRSYEPVNVITSDGRQWSGTIRDQSADEVVLQLNATETKVIQTSEIEEMLPGKVSVMPSGLDKQLSSEQLADLLAFLESRQ